MWYENGWEIYGPKRPIRSKEIDTSYLLIYDAIWVMQEHNPHQATLLARAAKAVLSRWGLKFCRSCRQAKILEDFYPISVSSFNPDGRMTYCKECDKSKHYDWQKENAEHFNKYQRELKRAMMDSLPDFMQRQQTLYRLFDENDRLLYVGITWNVRDRFYAHKADKVWWDDVARHELEEYPDRDSVLEAERVAIKTEFPIYNVLHA